VEENCYNYFKALSQHLSGGTEECFEKSVRKSSLRGKVNLQDFQNTTTAKSSTTDFGGFSTGTEENY
jgi:hypothetical protein